MKQAEKLSIAAGTVILGFAAVIVISLMFHFLDFGSQSGFVLKMAGFGSMLYGVYGLTSMLIPIYLIVASILLYLPRWTSRRGSYLIFSILPFFTIAGLEKLCRAFFSGSGWSFVLMTYSALVIISALIVAIEYLVFGLILDSADVSRHNREVLEAMHEEEVRLGELAEKAGENQDAVPAATESAEKELVVSDELTDNYIGYSQTSTEESLIFKSPNLEKISELETVEPDSSEQSELPSRIGPEQLPSKEVNDLIKDNPDIIAAEPAEPEPVISEPVVSVPVVETVSEVPETDVQPQPTEPEIITMQFGGLTDEPAWVTEDTTEDTSEDPAGYSDDNTNSFDTPPYRDFDAVIETGSSDENDIVFEDLDDDSYVPEPGEDDIDIPMPAADELYSSDEDAFMNDPFAIDDEELDEDERAALEAERSTYAQEYNQLTQEPADAPEMEDEGDEEDIAPQELSSPVPAVSVASGRVYSVPTEGLLNNFESDPYWIIDEKTKMQGAILKETLNEFKIEAEVTGIRKGPVVTMFEILPAPGVKLQKIVSLQDNIALRLAASSVRIVAPIPGKQAVGIEVPNPKRAVVSFRELIEKDLPETAKMAVPVVLGKDITGDAQMLDIATTPHLLIAGSTGSGKSVCVNSIILSILYKRSPDEVKMLLIDPKVVELKLYNDIPHLLSPVITEPKKAFQALQYCLCEMERRYAMLDRMGVRDIKTYNRRIKERNVMQEKMPYIVVIIDEFADLMATTGKELESTVARLAAMSRAVGIHLILATQRPSIDVITGLIKANIPTRIAFMVASKTDSRIIIDQVGAEKLLGKGDMLYASAVDPFPVRLQGTFVTEDEVERVVDYVKTLAPPQYIDDEIFVDDEDDELAESLFSDGEDPLYDQALEIVLQAGKASASYIQRRLKIGYNRAARLVEDMEARGIVGPANGSKPREIVHYPS